jgi:aspartate racemase
MNENQTDYIMGVIGGMGSKSTSYFLDEVFRKTNAKTDQEHINLICLNHATIPDRTEFIKQNLSEPLVSLLKKDIQILKDLKVKFISIPCNTVFFFLEKILQEENLKIISIVGETANYISQEFKEVKKVGVLATRGTVSSDIYRKALHFKNIECVYPNLQDQEKLMNIIYEQVKGGETGDIESLLDIIEKMKSSYGCDLVVLGCTELSFARRGKYIPDFCIDALDVLVEKSILLSGKEIKKEL